MKQVIKHWPILVIFVLGVMVRLWKIQSPLLDWHSWRQADTASVTRIWLDHGVDILHPRYYDISSIQTGIFNPQGLRMVEFPVFNVVHVGMDKIFPDLGVDMTGRLTAVLFSSFSIIAIYILGTAVYNLRIGQIAAALFAFMPYSVYYGRAVLPESAMVFFLLCSLVLAAYCAKAQRWWMGLLSALFFALVLLIKPYAVFFLLPILALLGPLFKGKGWEDKLFYGLIYIFVAFAPLLLWRIWVNQLPAGVPFFEWAFNGDGIRFHPAFWRWLFIERIGTLILGVWAGGFLVLGLLVKKYHSLTKWMLLASFIYLSVVATANVRHDYYQFLILPAIIMGSALGVGYLWESEDMGYTLKLLVVPATLALAAFSSFYQVKEYYKVNNPELQLIGARVNELTTTADRVVVPYNGDTAFLYQTGRFGWPAIDTGWPQLLNEGATVYVSLDKSSDDSLFVKDHFKLLEEGSNYVIYSLKNPVKPLP